MPLNTALAGVRCGQAQAAVLSYVDAYCSGCGFVNMFSAHSS